MEEVHALKTCLLFISGVIFGKSFMYRSPDRPGRRLKYRRKSLTQF